MSDSRFKLLISILLLLSAAFSRVASADVVTRFELQQGAAAPENVYVRLFDAATPLTVANFLKYANGTTVNGGSYFNTFIHRGVTDFVVQGGGFVFDPLNGPFINDPDANDYPGGLQEVDKDDPVQNEPLISNTAGTIAMAKVGGDPDSATSQWFINLVDNSSNLDFQNGGFTAFGKVIGNGMAVLDAVAAQPQIDKTDIHNAFSQLPLTNYTIGNPVLQINLMRVNRIDEMLHITNDFNFGLMLINTSQQVDIIITNRDPADLVIGAIADTDVIADPFSIVAGSDTCSGATISQSASCMLTLEFMPLTEDNFSDTFNIEFTSLGLSYTYVTFGEGALTIEPDIASNFESIDFGEAQLFDPAIGVIEQKLVTISNDGNIPLDITSITLEGTNASEFILTEFCLSSSPLARGAACNFAVEFKPTFVGEMSASIKIVSDDPDEGTFIIPITGSGSLDIDGVDATVEDAAPNDGDGNLDNIADSAQSNVVSFLSNANSYVTLVTSNGLSFEDVVVLSEEQIAPAPENIKFDLGVFDFKISGLFTGGTAVVGIILPAGVEAETFYMYGPTPDDTNPHWYEFVEDGTTGASSLGNVTITSPTGETMQRSVVQLVFKDGDRGDADLVANRVIVDPGGLVLAVSSSDDSGSTSYYFLLCLFVVLFFSRRYKQHLT